MQRFAGREEAGRLLADRLAAMGLMQPLVFALPRGGVPVAVELAAKLNGPLDLVLVRKIGAAGNPEVALGAIVEGVNAQVVINDDVMRRPKWHSLPTSEMLEFDYLSPPKSLSAGAVPSGYQCQEPNVVPK
ncbi:phosphoribosyltransferase family protein [Yoonia sp. SDW83-1]|uniref:phosphoribosyltransferase family protein n=1 Tax=Yoonia sp. SDW83-1 TaxID=3366945 RepID=UPI00398C79A0